MRRTLFILFAASFIPSASAWERTFHGRTLGEWKDRLRKGTPKERCRIATALGLGRFGKPAVPTLLKLLEDEDDQVRFCASVALRSLGPDLAESLPTLVALHQAAKHDADRYKINSVIAAAGAAAVPFAFRMKPDTYDSLIGTGLLKPEYYWRLVGSSRVLSDIGKPALPALEEALFAKEQSTRETAAMALFLMGKDAAPAAPSLARALGDSNIRFTVIGTLRNLGPAAQPAIPALAELLKEGAFLEHAALQTLLAIGKPAWPHLRTALKTGSGETRAQVLEHLHPDWDGALPLLLDYLADEKLRDSATLALGHFAYDLAPHLARIRRILEADGKRKLAWMETGLMEKLAMMDGSEEVVLTADCLMDFDVGIQDRAFASLRGCARQHGRQVAHALLQPLRRSHRFARKECLDILAHCGQATPEVVHAVCDALFDQHELVRMKAAETLGKLGPKVCAVRLQLERTEAELATVRLEACLRDQHPGVRGAAAVALCMIGHPSPSNLRLAATTLAEPKNPVWLRATAMRVLEAGGKLSRAVLPILVECIRSDDDFGKRLAADAIADLGPQGKGALDALRIALPGSERETRDSLVRALAAIGEPAVPVLKKALREEKAECQKAICNALNRSQPASRHLHRVLVELAGKRDEEEVWKAALQALDCLDARGEDVLRVVADAVAEDAWKIHDQMLEMLGRWGKDAAATMPTVRESLLHLKPYIRSAAIAALAGIDPDGSTILPDLEEALADPEEEVRAAVLAALGRMGRAARPLLSNVRAACKDRSDKVRIQVALAWHAIDGVKDGPMQVLEAVRRDGQGKVRVEAVMAMRSLAKHDGQLTMLLRLLEDDDAREEAEDELQGLGPEALGILPEVELLTKHRTYEVRAAGHRLRWHLKQGTPKRDGKLSDERVRISIN